MVDLKKVNWKVILPITLIVLVISSMLYKWYAPAEPPAGVVTKAPVSQKVEGVSKEAIKVDKVLVYDKTELAKKVNLPEEVKRNPKEEVAQVSDIKPSKAGTTVTTVIDKESGEVTNYQEPKKVPLLGFGGEARVGIGYEVGKYGPAQNVHVDYQFIRIGKVYGNVRGEVNTHGEYKSSVGVDYVW